MIDTGCYFHGLKIYLEEDPRGIDKDAINVRQFNKWIEQIVKKAYSLPTPEQQVEEFIKRNQNASTEEEYPLCG